MSCSCAFAYLAPLVLIYAMVRIVRKISKKGTCLIKGGHCLITGGSSGIGKSIALKLAQHGVNLSLVARNSDKLEKTAAEISASVEGTATSPVPKIQYFSVDVSKDYHVVEQAVKTAEATFGPIDYLICCAGSSVSGRVEDTSISDFKYMMDLNYFGTVNVIKAAVPQMKSRKSGNIVLVSSICGVFGIFGFSAYTGAKFALRGLAEVLHMELSPYGIGITVSLPPDTDTPGYEEEMKTKPLETKIISEGGGLVHPDVVADGIIKDMLEKNFFSTIGIQGKLFAILSAAASPISSFEHLFLEVLLVGPCRFIVAFLLYYCKTVVKKCAAQRNDSKKKE